MRKLGRELQDLEQIISSLRRYCADSVGAAAAPADTAVLTSLVSGMKACDEELYSLKQLLHSKAAAVNPGVSRRNMDPSSSSKAASTKVDIYA
jgi:hypothetical protein